jgi:hypothetical protein
VLRFLTNRVLQFPKRNCLILCFVLEALFIVYQDNLWNNSYLQKQIKAQEEIMISLFQGRGVLYFVIEIEKGNLQEDESVLVLKSAAFLEKMFDGKWDYVYVNPESVKPEEEGLMHLVIVSYKYAQKTLYCDTSAITQDVCNQLLEELPNVLGTPISLAVGITAIEAFDKLRTRKLDG